jgi:diguanylate cyclase (GGDEF)-like protein/PAS domain S-box-containing protein
MDPMKSEFKWRYWLMIWLVTIVSYGVLGKICIELGAIGGTASPFWLPAGLIVALSFLYGYRALPGIFLGQFLFATFFEPGTSWQHLMLAAGNVMEGASVYYLAPLLMRGNDPFASIRNFLSIFAATAAGSLINALIGAGALLLSGLIPHEAFGNVMLNWSIGDLGGALIVAPLIFAWWKPDFKKWHAWHIPEQALLLLIVCGISYVTFGGFLTLRSAPMAFFLLPLLLWSALRLELEVCTLLNAMMMGIVIWGTTHGHGPFATPSPTESLVLIQAFTSVIIVTSLLTYVVSQDRRCIMEKLRHETEMLEAEVARRTKALMQELNERKKTESALKDSEQRLRSIIETEPECIKVVDAKGRLVEMNAAGLNMLEADSLEHAQQHNLLDYVEPDDRADFIALHRRVMNGESGILVFRIKGLRGASRHLETHATPMRDADGNITALLGITRDVTERKKAEQQLRIAAIAFESQEGMLITNADGDILRVNQAFTEITGFAAEEVVGKNPSLLSSGRHGDAFYADMWNCIRNAGTWKGEVWNRRKNGEVYPEHLTITAVKDLDGRVSNYVASLTDITQSKATAEKIEQLAFFDPLTHLPNRRLLLDRVRQALASSARSGHQGAMLFLDLDHFKTLNDTRGHDIGDLLLQQVAVRLTACVREDDTVARLGGDEFVVILEDLSAHAVEAAAQAETVGDKIIDALNQPFQLGPHFHHTTPRQA